MNRTQRLSLIGILLAGATIGAVACGGSAEAPSPEAATADGSVETVSLKIEGMTWGGCALAVSQGLKAVAGVVDAQVSYDEQRADVEYRPDVVAPAALVEAVKETGFGATLLDGSAEGDGS